MHNISFILALGFVLAGPSIAGSADGSVPGIGSFSYRGTRAINTALPVTVARLTLAQRS